MNTVDICTYLGQFKWKCYRHSYQDYKLDNRVGEISHDSTLTFSLRLTLVHDSKDTEYCTVNWHHRSSMQCALDNLFHLYNIYSH